MLLIDKGFYDYDYEQVDERPVFIDWFDTIKTQEETINLVKRFGVGKKTIDTLDDIQEHIIKQESYGS